MDILSAIKSRHSVRSYRPDAIDPKAVAALREEIDSCNKEGGLHIQLVLNEEKAFSGMMAHYGKFSGVRNYIALIGEKSDSLDEKLGYYGERIVLKAQMLGLNTCWVAMTYAKGAVKKNVEIGGEEKLVCVLSLGYGTTAGVDHKVKDITEVSLVDGSMPAWFKSGMEAALLAPTAINQQKFLFTLKGENTVEAKSLGGFYSVVDLGIVKYHFLIGAGDKAFIWA